MGVLSMGSEHCHRGNILGAVHEVQCCPKNETRDHFCQTNPLPLMLFGGGEKYDIIADPLPPFEMNFVLRATLNFMNGPLDHQLKR